MGIGAENKVILAGGRLPDQGPVDVTVVDGRIVAVTPSDGLRPTGATVHDLAGRLLIPAMVEPHAHLDKALTAEVVPNPSGDLAGAIDAWVVASRTGMFNHDDTVARATRAIELLLAHGVTAVRTHVNTVPGLGAAKVLAVREAARSFAGLVEVQIVALPTTPLVGPEGAPSRRALADALTAGVDLVGGCPHLDSDGPGLIRLVCEAAAEAGLDVDLHVDETLDPSMLSLRDVARHVLDGCFAGAVTASHCVSLGVQSVEVQDEVARQVAAAGISVVTLPHTNLYLQGRDRPTATPRGLTAIDALCRAGALVAAGADNVQDPFNLVGRSDPMETAALLVMAGHRLPDEALAMVGNNGRRVLGLSPVCFRPGDPADLVAIDAPSVRAAIADSPSRSVFRGGRLVASVIHETTVHRSVPVI